MAKKPSLTFGQQVKGAAKQGVVEGVQNRISSGISTPRQKGPSHMGSLIVILLLGGFIFGTIVVPGLESGFWQSTLAPIAPIFEITNSLFSSLGRGLGNTYNLITKGESILSFETGGAEIKKKTGLAFQDLRTTASFVGDQVLIDGEIFIGKLDDSIKDLRNVELSCEFEGIKGDVQKGSREYGEQAIFDIPNQRKEEVLEPFLCVFDGTEIQTSLTKAINTKQAEIVLTYPLLVSSSLDVYVMPQNLYNNYRGREDEAFDQFLDGKSSIILSSTQFISDVETSMKFDKQPLGVGIGDSSLTKDGFYNLRIGFRNTDTGNKVEIKNFKINLPLGMNFVADKCPDFNIKFNDKNNVELKEIKNTYSATLSPLRFKDVQDALNEEGFGEKTFLCQVYVDQAALGGSSSPIVFAGKITSDLDSRYTLTEKETIVIRERPKST